MEDGANGSEQAANHHSRRVGVEGNTGPDEDFFENPSTGEGGKYSDDGRNSADPR
jgi:hypothetical protein